MAHVETHPVRMFRTMAQQFEAVKRSEKTPIIRLPVESPDGIVRPLSGMETQVRDLYAEQSKAGRSLRAHPLRPAKI
jgi:2-keto-3-deoxy-L-rhamnonate aldolase RhmA